MYTLLLQDFRPPANFSFSEIDFTAGLSGEFLFSGTRLDVIGGGSEVELRLPSEAFPSMGDLSWISLWDSEAKRSLADLFLEKEQMEAVAEVQSTENCQGKNILEK